MLLESGLAKSLAPLSDETEGKAAMELKKENQEKQRICEKHMKIEVVTALWAHHLSLPIVQ